VVRNKKTIALAAAALSGAMLAAGCSSGTSSGGGNGGADWAKATSARSGGGMKALIAAAKKEGQLNVITLPANWANYGTIMKDFTAK
jgi:putative spermidine/putrescine transport system substrate-binding protein